jgi:hypothetical protein
LSQSAATTMPGCGSFKQLRSSGNTTAITEEQFAWLLTTIQNHVRKSREADTSMGPRTSKMARMIFWSGADALIL